MKKALLAAYVFFCTGGTYAQERQNSVVAEIDFNRPTPLQFVPPKADTIRATLLISSGHMAIAHQRPGYVVYRQRDTIYLDDRMKPLKAPVTVWNVKLNKDHQ